MSKRADHLAHVGGVSGAGKTTLLEDLAKRHPGLVVKDVDDFDEDAKRDLKLPRMRGGAAYSDEMLTRLTAHKQKLLDAFLTTHAQSPVVTGGIHFEHGGTHALRLPAADPLMLDTSPLRASWRAYWRSRGGSNEVPYSVPEAFRHWRDNRSTWRDYRQLGQRPEPAAKVNERLDKLLASRR